jgi:hypothetical protein
MKAIAAESGDSLLLAAGPPHPDYQLLDVCGDALHFLKQADHVLEEERSIPFASAHGHDWPAWSAMRAEADRLLEIGRKHEARAVQLMRRARKLRATTPAGILAKALLVRAARSGTQVLAMTLADDLIACKGLRDSLWPDCREVA